MSDDRFQPELPPIVSLAGDIDEEPLSPEDAAVLTALERLQNQRPSWWGALGVLAVSLVLYTGASRTEQAWDGVWMLIGVLFFHELGHYVAMRIFRYRNVRMFFIPFFGAAVSGRHYNSAGWKKAVVALAGPLPGIVIAAPLGVAGLVLDQPLLVQLASLSLILNGFNLLPFLPLDGGWIVHAVLFVRHPVLDVVFRVLAALALIAVSSLIGSWILIAAGVLMLLGIPLAWRLARIAHDLGQRGVVALALDADSIPREAALPILVEVRKALPANASPAVLAQNVANVFETLNAYPPGALASVAILGVHAASFVAAVVLIVLLNLPHPLG
jgi:Zn-dependent protease